MSATDGGSADASRLRVAVYTDYVYRRIDGVIHAERAFALFLSALRDHVRSLRLIGRLATDAGDAPYVLPGGIELAGLENYTSLTDPTQVLGSLLRSLRQMWRALDDVDVVWVLGPYPHAFVLALLALARRRTLVLGLRQDWPRYVRMRHPRRRLMHLAADLMEWAWRTLAHRVPVVAVGAELASGYAHAPAVLDLVVSLVPASAVLASPPEHDRSGRLQLISVGRLEEEKNPLLLADILARLVANDPRWNMIVCGQGDLREALERRLGELGVLERAELRGYVPMGEGLLELYRSSDALLHVSWTEGFPQVLVEAMASGLPIVATAVGGVARGVGDAALLVAPGSSEAAVDALVRLARDERLRKDLIARGLARARSLTLERQISRLAAFLAYADARARRLRTAT